MSTLKTITGSFDVGQLTNGPFSVAGALYQLCNTGHAPLQMFKSSDQGATWTVQDSTHAPTSSLNGVSFCFDGVNTLWCAYANGSGFVEFIPYDTATDLYGTITTTTNAASDNQMFVCYRPVDAKLVYVITTSLPNRAVSFVFDTIALTFTGFQPMGTSGQTAFPAGAFQDGALTYIVFSTLVLFYQSVDGTGAIGTIVNIDTGGTIANPLACVASNTTQVFVAWVPGDDATVNAWTAPISTLVFTEQILSSFVQIQNMAAVIQGSTVRLFVSDNDVDGDLFEVDDNGLGFGAPFVLIALGGFAFVLANLVSVTPGYGIVVDTQPPVSYLFQGPALGPIVKHLDAGGVMIAPLPSIGSVCKFARPVTPTKGPRVIQVGKQLTYPEGYVR